MPHPNYEDLPVYLEVSGRDEQELMLLETTDPAAVAATTTTKGGNSPNSPSDSDSGHGSCDSHTLLMEKCGEGEAVKEEQQEGEESEQGDGEAAGRSRRGKQRWERRGSWEGNNKKEEEGDQEMAEGRVKTWPSVFTPLDEYAGSKALDRGSALGAARLHCSSVHSFPPLLPTSATSPSGLPAQERLHWQPHSRSESSIQSLEPKHQRQQQGGGMTTATTTTTTISRPAQPHSPFQATEYVEVQRVNQENMMVLRPLSSAQGQREVAPQGEEDYSRVKGLNSGNVLLLQRAVDAETEVVVEEGQEEEEEYPSEVQEKNSLLREDCYTAPPAVPGQMTGTCKPSVGLPTAVSLQGDMILAANGYVDTAVAMMPTH